MTAKKPRKIDPRWAHKLFRELLNARNPKLSKEEIGAMEPGLYKHRVGLAAKAATKALLTIKTGWERRLLLELLKELRPDCQDAETYSDDILEPVVADTLRRCANAMEGLREKDETFTRVIRDNNALQTEITQCKNLAKDDAAYVRDLRELVKNLRLSLKGEQRMGDALRASLSGSEIISVGPDGDVTTVRQHLRATAQERYDEIMKEGPC